MKSNYLVLSMGILLMLASIITAMYQDWGQSGSLLIDSFLLIILSIYIKSITEKKKMMRKKTDVTNDYVNYCIIYCYTFTFDVCYIDYYIFKIDDIIYTVEVY